MYNNINSKRERYKLTKEVNKMESINNNKPAGVCGGFRVYENGSIEGPTAYMATLDMARIMRHAKVLAPAMAEQSVYQVIALALATDAAEGTLPGR